MKILYAIQGTGNGHMARAEEVIPILKEFGELDLFVSGSQADIRLPYPIRYTSKGLSFYFGKQGGIDFIKTLRNNNLRRVFREIRDFPVCDYDLIINDFESISAWACKQQNVPCLALSHQFALTSPKVPKPAHRDAVGSWFLANYAPVERGIGFHFAAWDRNIFTPVIRQRIRTATIKDKGHITVYLPAYSDEKIIQALRRYRGIRWDVFSKHTRKAYETGNLRIRPVDNESFTSSVTTSSGVVCGAGFETPAEALYLGKRLLVIPMKNQYEQHYNAAGLAALGVPVMPKLSENHAEIMTNWLESNRKVHVHFEDQTQSALERLFKMHRKDQV